MLRLTARMMPEMNGIDAGGFGYGKQKRRKDQDRGRRLEKASGDQAAPH